MSAHVRLKSICSKALNLNWHVLIDTEMHDSAEKLACFSEVPSYFRFIAKVAIILEDFIYVGFVPSSNEYNSFKCPQLYFHGRLYTLRGKPCLLLLNWLCRALSKQTFIN